MISFVGEYSVRIDAKGRLVLPSALKKQGVEADSAGMYVLKEDMYERCLVLYPAMEWERQNAIIRNKINPFDREHNQFLRSFSKGACEISLDSVNRILIPKRLLEYAQIERDVVLSGQDGKIEIWAAEIYQQMWNNAPDFEILAKKVMNN